MIETSLINQLVEKIEVTEEGGERVLRFKEGTCICCFPEKAKDFIQLIDKLKKVFAVEKIVFPVTGTHILELVPIPENFTGKIWELAKPELKGTVCYVFPLIEGLEWREEEK
ncbi:MAG: hypothetical protein WC435_02025 [Candidatus Paceibacterota bacterium]